MTVRHSSPSGREPIEAPNFCASTRARVAVLQARVELSAGKVDAGPSRVGAALPSEEGNTRLAGMRRRGPMYADRFFVPAAMELRPDGWRVGFAKGVGAACTGSHGSKGAVLTTRFQTWLIESRHRAVGCRTDDWLTTPPSKAPPRQAPLHDPNGFR